MNNKVYQLLKRILKEGRPFLPSFLLLGGIGLLMVPVELYGLTLSRKMIDQGFLRQNWDLSRSIIIVLVVLFVIRSVISYTTVLFSARLRLRIDQKFQGRIFFHLLRLPMRVLTQQPAGRLMSRILDDGALFSTIFEQAFGRAIQEPIKLIVLSGLLIYFNIRLWAVMLISTVVSFIVIRWVGRKLHDISLQVQKKDAAIYSFLEQMLTNLELIKSKTTEYRTASRFRQHLGEFIQLSLSIHKVSLIARPILQVLKYLAIGAVLLYGSWMISSGIISIGTLTIFLGATFLFFNSINSVGSTYGSLRENLARMEAVYSILDTPAESNAIEYKPPKRLTIESVTFENIVFGYTPAAPVLKGVSFNIHKGNVFGVTGQSGSGKTTLLRLLVRFYEADSGDILLNGQSIHRLKLTDLRSSIGIVFQENFILNDSIRNNIAYGAVDITDEQIERAAQVSGAHRFIVSLPDHYSTIVGERGKRLSGGQRQRLAIARAVAVDPEILILDEGTSFLDVEQEAAILQDLKKHRHHKITIIVTHRLSAMKMADRIITLDNGRILETDFQALVNAVRVA